MRSINVNIKSGQALLSTTKKDFKHRLLIMGAAIFMVIASVPLLSTSAFAATEYAAAGTVGSMGTVPNRFECSQWTKQCRQINGNYVNGLPNACRMVWSWFNGSMHESGCSPNHWW